MSSTTIRYSGVPENSHSIEVASDLDTNSTSHRAAETRAESSAQTAADIATAAASAAAHYGLVAQVDGYYDWAGRRLFLLDGSPDPLTPGAYRYQVSPDLCDLSAPESDPANPRYEPAHLRHQPGDTWQIGGKPFDIDDPGPYGNPLWRPDPRTGRHRRGELPDPIRPSASTSVSRPSRSEAAPAHSMRTGTGPAQSKWAELDPTAPSHSDSDPQPEPASSGSVPPWRPPPRTASPPPEPPDDEGEDGDQGQGGQSSPRLPIVPDRQRPVPREHSRFWSQTDSSEGEQTMNLQRRNHFEHDSDNTAPESRLATGPQYQSGAASMSEAGPESARESGPAHEPEFQFSKMREAAWDRFLVKSQELAADHHRTNALLRREGGWAFAGIVVLLRWIAAVFKRQVKAEAPQRDQRPEPRSERQHVPDRAAQEERCALAARSSRFAAAVRGAQRARAEAAAAQGNSVNDVQAGASASRGASDRALRGRPYDSSPGTRPKPQPGPRAETIGSRLIGGAAWA